MKRKKKRLTISEKKKRRVLTQWKTPQVHALDRLPVEIWHIIMMYCTYDALHKLASVSKWFYETLKENADFWKRNLRADWVHAIFADKPRRLIGSNLMHKCFSCWKYTTRCVRVGLPSLSCFACLQCSRDENNVLCQMSTTKAWNTYKISVKDVRELYCCYSAINLRGRECSWWYFSSDVKDKAIQVHGGSEELQKRLEKSHERSDRFKEAREVRAKERDVLYEKRVVELKGLMKELDVELDRHYGPVNDYLRGFFNDVKVTVELAERYAKIDLPPLNFPKRWREFKSYYQYHAGYLDEDEKSQIKTEMYNRLWNAYKSGLSMDVPMFDFVNGDTKFI
jgi:hypothetical protein